MFIISVNTIDKIKTYIDQQDSFSMWLLKMKVMIYLRVSFNVWRGGVGGGVGRYWFLVNWFVYGGLFLIHIISWSRIFAILGLKHNSTQQRKLPCWRSRALFFSSSLNVKFSQWHHRFVWLPTTTFLSVTEHFPDHVGNLDWFYLFIYLFICRCGRCYMTTLIHSWELVSTQPPPVSCSITVQREVFS